MKLQSFEDLKEIPSRNLIQMALPFNSKIKLKELNKMRLLYQFWEKLPHLVWLMTVLFFRD